MLYLLSYRRSFCFWWMSILRVFNINNHTHLCTKIVLFSPSHLMVNKVQHSQIYKVKQMLCPQIQNINCIQIQVLWSLLNLGFLSEVITFGRAVHGGSLLELSSSIRSLNLCSCNRSTKSYPLSTRVLPKLWLYLIPVSCMKVIELLEPVKMKKFEMVYLSQ